MKLHSITIKNFRAIESGAFDFTDNFSKPRTVTLIVGPNGSGKTSVLDAIHIVVRTLEDPYNPRLREGLEFSAQQIVKGRGNIAEINFSSGIDLKEAEAINEVYKALRWNTPFSFKDKTPPLDIPSNIKWQFPNPNKTYKKPFSAFTSPRNAAKVIGARGNARKGVAENFIGKSIFEKIGSVCYLDQRRSFRITKSYSVEKEELHLPYDDVLSWLNIYRQRNQTWNQEKYGESYWSRIERLFDKICYPAELIGIESGPDIDTLIIRKNGVEYDLAQMSSGEHQILRILVGLIAETAENSIVLIDEIELHLHPAWQRKLIETLRNDSLNNQYVFTTHSQFVKQLFFDDEIIDLGDLDESI
ncbi:MAG: AAA family ATPase [Deltaproteobacteria bacterium]|nr:AAA family ATPase [Deltaproteobacteria bacterium]